MEFCANMSGSRKCTKICCPTQKLLQLNNREILVKRFLLAFPLMLRVILQEKLREIP